MSINIMSLSKRSKEKLSEIGLLFTVVIWGTTFVVVKDVLQNVDPFILVGFRFLISAFALGIPLILIKKKLFHNLKQGIILGFFLWLIYMHQTIGLQYTTASNSVFITGLFIIFIPIFSLVIFKKIPSIIQISSILLSVVGFWFLTGGITSINKGDVITLITAMGGALHILIADHYIKKNTDPFVLNYQQFLFVSVMSFTVGKILHKSFDIGNISTLWAIFFLALVPGLLGYILQLIGQKYITPVKVALILALEPVFGALFAWTVGGEKLILLKAFGGSLIVIAIVFPDVLKLFKLTK